MNKKGNTFKRILEGMERLITDYKKEINVEIKKIKTKKEEKAWSGAEGILQTL